CFDGHWPSGTAPALPTTLGTSVFDGLLSTIWPYDEVRHVWRMPENGLDGVVWQPLQMWLKTATAQPTLTMPNAELDPVSLQHTMQDGSLGYLVRSRFGFELIRQYSPSYGLDFHWGRRLYVDEFLTRLKATVPALNPTVTIAGVGDVPVINDGACGSDLVQDMME
ncbi:MAG: hypothetical protein V2A73_15225, partial [Pseudomonadota bacterium]